MVGLPKSIIKKYGVSKKAWSVFRSRGSASKTKKISRGASSMAKRRSSRRSGGFGSNKLMNGFYKPSGMLGNALMGIGAAAVAQKIPINVPYKGVIAAGVVGGVPGAGAVLLLNSLNGSTSDSGSDLVSGY